MRCVEDICVFYKKKSTYNPQGLIRLEKPIIHNVKGSSVYGTKKNPSIQKYTGYPHHLLEFKVPAGKERLHPTQKPVELLEYLIKTYTDEKAVVLDNCMGSGSTCVACVNTNRRYIGFELDKDYFNISRKRLDEAEVTAWFLKIKNILY